MLNKYVGTNNLFFQHYYVNKVYCASWILDERMQADTYLLYYFTMNIFKYEIKFVHLHEYKST